MPDLVSPLKKQADSEHLIETILATIADIEDTDPLQMSPPLYDTVDPDALQTLLASADDTLHITFTYRSHTITVSGTGEYRIEPRSRTDDSCN